MMKKLDYKILGVSCLTVSFMLFSVSQPQAAVGNTFTEGNLKYTVLTEDGSNGTVEVKKNGSVSGDLTIPDSVENDGITYSVTSIESWAFEYCSSLASITIPDSVTSIGEGAFSRCSSLVSIVIPDGVTSIGVGAFSNCSRLTSVTIGDSVTSIGSSAFSRCSSLVSIVIPDGVTSIGYGAFEGCDQLPPILFSVGEKILVRYSSSNTETSYTIPDTVVSIADYAFYDCYYLTSITIPDSVTSIGDFAFSRCDSLVSIVIPDGVASIGSCAFSSCSSLTSVYFKGDAPNGSNIYGYWSSTPDTLISYYPEGNATWEAVIVDGQWQGRGVATWNPEPQPEDVISFIPSTEEGILTLTFTGTLEESDDAIHWTPVPDAKGSYDVDTTAERKKFYRFVK